MRGLEGKWEQETWHVQLGAERNSSSKVNFRSLVLGGIKCHRMLTWSQGSEKRINDVWISLLVRSFSPSIYRHMSCLFPYKG